MSRTPAESALAFAVVQLLRAAAKRAARGQRDDASDWLTAHYERVRRKVLLQGCSLEDVDAAIESVVPRVTPPPLPDEQTPAERPAAIKPGVRRKGWFWWPR